MGITRALCLGLWLLLLLLLISAFYYFWPQRIFIHYLWKNNKTEFRVHLVFWRWKFPFQVSTGKGGGESLNLKRLKNYLEEIRPYRKKFIWNRFKLVIDLGLGDPALTGMAAGGGWALGGAFLSLLYHYFRFETEPVLKINPGFQNIALKIDWEGEITASPSLWLKLWAIFKKTGGSAYGRSSD